MRRYRSGFSQLWCGRVLVACVFLWPAHIAWADTLYDELGGKVGLERIVYGMERLAKTDPRLADKFENIDMAYLGKRLVLRLCGWTGGPCPKNGPSMKGIHAGLGLNDRHFFALIEDLEASMDEAGPTGCKTGYWPCWRRCITTLLDNRDTGRCAPPSAASCCSLRWRSPLSRRCGRAVRWLTFHSAIAPLTPTRCKSAVAEPSKL